jgi:hypothetical protein
MGSTLVPVSDNSTTAAAAIAPAAPTAAPAPAASTAAAPASVDKMDKPAPAIPTKSAGGFFRAVGATIAAPNETAFQEIFHPLAGENTGDRVADISGGILHSIFSLPETALAGAGDFVDGTFKALYDTAGDSSRSTFTRIMAGIGAVLLAIPALFGVAASFAANIIFRNTTSRVGDGIDWLIHRASTPMGKVNYDVGVLAEDVGRYNATREIKPYIDLN